MEKCYHVFIFLLCIFGISCKKESKNTNSENKWIKEGLIAYYPFNANTNDESGNHYNLKNHGAILTINRNGEQNKAFLFDGTSAFMSIPPIIKGDNMREYTISVWVQPKTSTQNVILSFLPKEDSLCAGYLSVSKKSNTLLTEHGMPYLITKNNCTSAIIGDEVAITSASWFHIVLVQRYNYENSIYGYRYDQYVNGVKLKAGSSSFGVVPDLVSFAHGGIVGSSNSSLDYSFNFNFFEGAIDDIRIYNKSLSETDIQKLYAYKE